MINDLKRNNEYIDEDFHFKKVPYYNNGIWEYKTFNNQDVFKEYIERLFKEPGEYSFDKTSFLFNTEARRFKEKERYCEYPEDSLKYVEYWESEKEKCRFGAIFSNGVTEWYICRELYMWINFLRINDKKKKKVDFPLFWDTHYHIALYELIAELNNKHAAITKKRQLGSSYYHMAKAINLIWFEESPIIKIGASLRKYINEDGSWRFLVEYKSFLNKETAWYRPMTPEKVLTWQQQIAEKDSNGRETMVGLKGVIQGNTFEKDATSGVGGATRYFFMEEAGIAPKMDKTIEYLFPAMQSGEYTTGLFVAAGSVGELTQCEPLKDMMYHPDKNRIQAVDNKYFDKTGAIRKTALFIPEQWSMPPYIDEYGNSLVDEALNSLNQKYAQWKKELSPNIYQLRISQNPRDLEEAFAWREDSIFPLHLVKAQENRIIENEYSLEYVDLYYNDKGQIKHKSSNKSPISDFPVSMKMEDKSGCIVIHEHPLEKTEFGTYYASVDPVGVGKAEWVENKLITQDGYKKIGEIEIGDCVMNPDGLDTVVTGIHPQGEVELYRIFFSDNTSILVCKDHLWAVRSNDDDKKTPHVFSVSQLLDKDSIVEFNGIGININKKYKVKTYYKKDNGSNKWRIPISRPLNFNKNVSLPVEPYLLGALLGDGGLTSRSIIFSTVDCEILEYFKESLPDDITIKKSGKCGYRLSTSKHRNSITQKLRELSVFGCNSYNKFIPFIYLRSSIENRLKLLRGLMDTDGWVDKRGNSYFGTTSINLANDISELIRSLGGVASVTIKKRGEKMRKYHIFYNITVSLPDNINPFRLKRKYDNYKSIRRLSKYIVDIKYERKDKAVCITVDNQNHLYLTENYIVTHNSTTSDSLASIYIYKRPMTIERTTNGTMETFVSPDKIVAWWCGRFDDIKDTHKRLLILIEYYNAWTLVENNVKEFITFMINETKQKYLVPKNQFIFLKDITPGSGGYEEYGWRNVSTVFLQHLMPYFQSYIREVINEKTDENGNVYMKNYGIERIPDIMVMKEMSAYNATINVDRIVSLVALIAFAKIQEASRGVIKRKETDNNLENNKNLYKLNVSPFRHIGNNKSVFDKTKRSGFKNLK